MNRFVISWMLLFCSLTVAQQKFNLDIYASKYDSIPIGILPFTPAIGEPAAANRPWEIIAADLSFSGRFQVFKFEQFDSSQFAAAGIGIYIDGEYGVENGALSINCFLRDMATKEQIAEKKYHGDLKSARNMAHRFSNQIMEMIFGSIGAFESRILFVKEEGQAKNLWIMDFDGFNSRQLTFGNSINVFPVFADSSTVLWTAYLRGKPDIYRGSIATGASKIFVYSRFVQCSPAVSPVDGQVAYGSSKSGNMEVYVCDADGTNTRQITFNRAIDTAPAWSPNGYQIAFTSDRSGQPQIYVCDADGANVRRLTYEGKYQDSPAWSPKGDRIAYTSLSEGKFDICTIGVDGSSPAKLTSIPGNNEYPSFSPDGAHLVFSNRINGKKWLYIIRADGSNCMRLNESGSLSMPDWSM